MNQPVDLPRKKSPRAPSMALDEAIERVMKAYDKDRLHPAPTDVVAQHLGYKGASNGAALSALASLRYYGLLERPRDGMLAVSKEVEAYKFSPSDEIRGALLRSFLRRPALFAELLDKYGSRLPSDANLKYDLIQRGFLPATAAALVTVFKRSVEFVGASAHAVVSEAQEVLQDAPEVDEPQAPEVAVPGISRQAPSSDATINRPLEQDESAHDRIPVRLPGGRRAWLVIPTPFYASDKLRLKAQIDLLLTEEDEPLA